MPPMPTPPAADTTMAAGPDVGAPAAPAGPKYTVCIDVAQDDSLSVRVETAAQEAAENGGEGEEAEGGTAQPAASKKEALTMALAALNNDGKLPDLQAQNDEFDKGFSGSPAQAGMGQ